MERKQHSKEAREATLTDTSEEESKYKQIETPEQLSADKKMKSFLKTIVDLSLEEQINALIANNRTALENNRTYKGSIQMLQRRNRVLIEEKSCLVREKEQLENEHSKSVLFRTRLETVCRELQRQNKAIRDESLQKIREEEEKRKETSSRFQSALNEVSIMLQLNADKNIKLRDDNVDLSEKFQQLYEQFQQRESDMLKLTKQIELEKQLAEATVKRSECQLSAEREIWAKEKEHGEAKLQLSEDERVKLEGSIKHLETLLSKHNARYEEFESTISRSNRIFDSYKLEMSRLTKQTNKLELECTAWKARWNEAQKTIADSLLEGRALKQVASDRERKLVNISNLCRLVQQERLHYLKQLKEHGITPDDLKQEEQRDTLVSETTTAVIVTQSDIVGKEQELESLREQMNLLELQCTVLKHEKKEGDSPDSDESNNNAGAASLAYQQAEFDLLHGNVKLESDEEKLFPYGQMEEERINEEIVYCIDEDENIVDSNAVVAAASDKSAGAKPKPQRKNRQRRSKKW